MSGEQKGSFLHNYSNSSALTSEGEFRYDPSAKLLKFYDDTSEKTVPTTTNLASVATPSGAEGIGVRDDGALFTAPKNVENILQQLGSAQTRLLLLGRVSAGGGVNLNVGVGAASFSVAKPTTGTYDITLTGITGSVVVVAHLNSNDPDGGNNRPLVGGGVTAKGSDTDGYPTNTGFRFVSWRMYHGSCGGCPVMDYTTSDRPFSFMVFQG